MAVFQIQLDSIGVNSGPFYNIYFSADCETYTLLSASVFIPTTSTIITVDLPDTTNCVKLENTSEICDNSVTKFIPQGGLQTDGLILWNSCDTYSSSVYIWGDKSGNGNSGSFLSNIPFSASDRGIFFSRNFPMPLTYPQPLNSQPSSSYTLQFFGDIIVSSSIQEVQQMWSKARATNGWETRYVRSGLSTATSRDGFQYISTADNFLYRSNGTEISQSSGISNSLITFTFNTALNESKFYINGNLASFNNATLDFDAVNEPLIFGFTSGSPVGPFGIRGTAFNGWVRDLLVYNRVLQPNEVLANWEALQTSSCIIPTTTTTTLSPTTTTLSPTTTTLAPTTTTLSPTTTTLAPTTTTLAPTTTTLSPTTTTLSPTTTTLAPTTTTLSPTTTTLAPTTTTVAPTTTTLSPTTTTIAPTTTLSPTTTTVAPTTTTLAPTTTTLAPTTTTLSPTTTTLAPTTTTLSPTTTTLSPTTTTLSPTTTTLSPTTTTLAPTTTTLSPTTTTLSPTTTTLAPTTTTLSPTTTTLSPTTTTLSPTTTTLSPTTTTLAPTTTTLAPTTTTLSPTTTTLAPTTTTLSPTTTTLSPTTTTLAPTTTTLSPTTTTLAPTTTTTTVVEACIEIDVSGQKQEEFLDCGVFDLYNEYSASYFENCSPANAPVDITVYITGSASGGPGGDIIYSLFISSGSHTSDTEFVYTRIFTGEDCQNRQSETYTITVGPIDPTYPTCSCPPL